MSLPKVGTRIRFFGPFDKYQALAAFLSTHRTGVVVEIVPMKLGQIIDGNDLGTTEEHALVEIGTLRGLPFRRTIRASEEGKSWIVDTGICPVCTALAQRAATPSVASMIEDDCVKGRHVEKGEG